MIGVCIKVHGATTADFEIVMDNVLGSKGEFDQPLMASFSGSSHGDMHFFQIWTAKRDFQSFWERQVEPVLRREGIHTEPETSFFEISDMFIHPDSIDQLLSDDEEEEEHEEGGERKEDDNNEESQENND